MLYNKKIDQLTKKNIKLLFFSDNDFYYDKIKNKKVNFLIDPYYENVKNKYNSLKVEIVSNQFYSSSIKRNEPFYLKLFLLDIKGYLKKSISNYFKNGKNNNKENQISFKPGLKTKNFDKIIDELNNIIYDSKNIELFIKKIKPRAVFFTCYYSHKNLSVILACRKLKIPTIDIQHGGHELYHLMYSNWNKMPKNGFELLPDYFWIWGENQKNEGIFKDLKTKHKYVVGGKSQLNFWEKNKKSLYQNIKYYQKNFLLKKNYKKTILFCSTFTKIPEIIFKIIKKSPNDWLWLIRAHPRHANLKKIKSQFENSKIKNVEIDFPSTVDLYFLLNNVSHVIVEFSSIIYDSLYFNVPSIVLQKNKNHFKKNLKSPKLKFSLNENNIIKFIKKNNYNNDNDKIVSGEKFAIKAVKQILADYSSK